MKNSLIVEKGKHGNYPNPKTFFIVKNYENLTKTWVYVTGSI